MEQQRKAFDEWVIKHPDYRALTIYEEKIMFDAWLAAQQQEGYVMVPVEPTSDMLKSGNAEREGKCCCTESIYKAMIQAAQE